MPLPDQRTIIKQNSDGEEVWRYSGEVLQTTPDAVLVEAVFNREDFVFEGILIKNGDPFIEAYYSRRWYNIFEMIDRDSGETKGWYCNVTRPALLRGQELSYMDLALDILVYPDGQVRVLDEDEYQKLNLSEDDQKNTFKALEELKSLFSLGVGFHLKEIFPVTNPYEAKLKSLIVRSGWQIEHLSFDVSTHSVAEAAAVVNARPDDLVKNICMFTADDRLVVAIVKGEDRVSPGNLAESLGLEGKPRLATAEEILARTGYPMGGTPSFGFDGLFVMDERVFEKEIVFTGGGSPSALARATPQELQRANRGLTAYIRK